MSQDTKGDKTIQDRTFGDIRCKAPYTVSPKFFDHYGLTSQPEPIGDFWECDVHLDFFGKNETFTLYLPSADWTDVLEGTYTEGYFTEFQRNAYLGAISQWAEIQQQLKPALLNAYHSCLELIDYGHDEFKPVTDFSVLLPDCWNWTIEIPWQEDMPRRFTVSCRCPWDGHGFHASFEDEKLIECS